MEASLSLILTLTASIITACTAQDQILGSDNDICRLFNDGTLLREPGSCSKALICKGGQSYPHLDCGKKFWDRNSQTCVKSTKDKYCKTACTMKSPQFVRDRKNCNGWNECKGRIEVSRGECANGLHFDQQRQLCVYPENSKCVAKYGFCDVVPDNLPFKDENNCHKYYECKTSLRRPECPIGTYFDAKATSCVPKAQVDCYKHPYPENVCGDNKLPIRNQFVSDGATCRGHFYCREQPNRKPDPEPVWGQCAKDLFFEPREQICIAKTHVRCTEDRCDGVRDGKTLSSQRGCQHYLICQNGYTIREEYCGDVLLPLLLFLSAPIFLRAEKDICRLFKDGTEIRKPGSCNEYIRCENSTSIVSTCSAGLLFDLKKKACVNEDLVSDDTSSYCTHNCDGRDDYWVADLTSCNGFYYCSNGIGEKAFCPDGYHFDESRQMCVHNFDSLCIDVFDICQVAPANVKFRNEANCNSYYECKITKGKTELNRAACKSNEYFNVESGKCGKKHEISCEKHPIPKKVCGVNGKAKKGAYVADQATCTGYFYCADLGYLADVSPIWARCPEGTFFNQKTQQCSPPHTTPCSYNRCEGRGTRLVESSTNDCHNYWVCVNGMPVEERTCPGDLFFNSSLEVCGREAIYYPSCDRCQLTKC